MRPPAPASVPAIILLDVSANVLVVVVVLLLMAMARPAPVPQGGPLTLPILADRPTGGAAIVDALYARSRQAVAPAAVELLAEGVRVKGVNAAAGASIRLDPAEPAFPARLRRTVGPEGSPVDLFVFDARHHAAVRAALGKAVVREVTVPPSLRDPSGAWWSPEYAHTFGQNMKVDAFRARLGLLLAGGTAGAPAAPGNSTQGAPRYGDWLTLLSRMAFLALSLAIALRLPRNLTRS